MESPADSTGVLRANDATGEIGVVIEAPGRLGVALGPFTKSHYSAVECAVTIQGLMNRVAGEAWSRRVTARLRARVAVFTGSEHGAREDIGARLARVSASLDRAKVAVEATRQGEGATPARTAGRRDRVWIEARDGFVVQVLIDETYFATCPVDGLAAEITACLADVMAPWANDRFAAAHDGEEGDYLHG